MLIYQKMTWLKSGRVFFFLFYNFQYLSNYSEGQMHRVALKKKKKLLASRLMLGLNLSRVSPELSVHNESTKPSIVNSSVSCLIRLYVNVMFQVPAVYPSVYGVKFDPSLLFECHRSTSSCTVR